ncbi:MAG: hypothetical protein QXP36_00095 [Conexivisphaerales archaeon]
MNKVKKVIKNLLGKRNVKDLIFVTLVVFLFITPTAVGAATSEILDTVFSIIQWAVALLSGISGVIYIFTSIPKLQEGLNEKNAHLLREAQQNIIIGVALVAFAGLAATVGTKLKGMIQDYFNLQL